MGEVCNRHLQVGVPCLCMAGRGCQGKDWQGFSGERLSEQSPKGWAGVCQAWGWAGDKGL